MTTQIDDDGAIAPEVRFGATANNLETPCIYSLSRGRKKEISIRFFA